MTPALTLIEPGKIEPRDHRTPAGPRPIAVERRSGIRFPLGLRVTYQGVKRGNSFAGVGWVVNISSGGILVAHPHDIPAGAQLELNIEWPSLLEGRIPLKLVTFATVVRSETSGFAAVLGGYQFRTAPRTTRSAVVPIDAPGDIRSLTANMND